MWSRWALHKVAEDPEETSAYVLIIKPTKCTNFLKFIFGIKLYMFRTVPLSVTRSFSLYIQQWYMSYRFADSLRAGAGRIIQSFIPKINLRKLSASSWFYYKNFSRCTVTWMSNSASIFTVILQTETSAFLQTTDKISTTICDTTFQSKLVLNSR